MKTGGFLTGDIRANSNIFLCSQTLTKPNLSEARKKFRLKESEILHPTELGLNLYLTHTLYLYNIQPNHFHSTGADIRPNGPNIVPRFCIHHPLKPDQDGRRAAPRDTRASRAGSLTRCSGRGG